MSSRRVIIALKGLGTLANHGVYDFERTQEQRFSADVIMWVETAGNTDDITATVSYADIADETMSVLTGTPVDLIETLAETIASRVMEHEGIVGTEVTVHKPDAPLGHPFSDVSVTVRQGDTDAAPLSLTLAGLYEAEDGSVLVGEINGHAQAPIPAPQERREASPSRRSARGTRRANASMPAHLRSRRVVLAIGGNLGDVPVTLMHTVEALSYMEGFQIEDVSPIMRTKPVLAPGQAPQPDYWNAVVVGTAIASPDELFAQTSRIEHELGRERHEHWGPRTIDIDIIQIEGLASADPALLLPHPRAKERAFVLAPWLLCEPDAILEGVGRVADLLATTPDREGIIDAVDDWLEDPWAVIADSDELLSQRAEQASADMRELIDALTGEISQVAHLVTRPGESGAPPARRAETDAPPGQRASRNEADATDEGNDEDSAAAREQDTTPSKVDAAETTPPAATTRNIHTSTDEEHADSADAANADAEPIADQANQPQRDETNEHEEPPASSRPAWHPVSSVPADSPAGRMTRKIGVASYTPSGADKPRWVPVFETKREETRSEIALPDWNFSAEAAHDVRVVDDRSGLGDDTDQPKATVHADGRSTILVPGISESTPVGPIPEEEATHTGILRNVVVRPAPTGAIPIVKRR